ncbi:hypothetical protein LJC48_03325 [Desulfovibrio sp. OttesenSCG-928-C06]|nr:hypothetical protein [Desulfovibrio sp. OttesenSCG-928-C06]
MKKTKNFQMNDNDDFHTPSKCAESPLTRWDGGIRSEEAAQANLAAASAKELEPDLVDTCALNQITKAGLIGHEPIQGGPAGHLSRHRPKGKSL